MRSKKKRIAFTWRKAAPTRPELTNALGIGGRSDSDRSASAGKDENEKPELPESSWVEVKAPLVGVFYAAPSPEAPPFVQVGDRVEQGQVLCLVEAMKMMNQLKSPVSGIVRGIGGVDGELAEYGQVLFEVEPC